MAFKTGKQTKEQTPETNKPVHMIRFGCLSVSIWRREGKDAPWYSATLQRAFKRDGAEDWEYTDNLNRDDLLGASKLLDLAHTWIVRAEAKDREAGKQEQE